VQGKDKIVNKKCGLCGAMVEGGILECPKCGSGVFESERSRQESQKIENKVAPIQESEAKRSWVDKLLGRRPKDQWRDVIEQQIRVYLKAARYIATCGRFNEEKFDHVERILSRSPRYKMDPQRISQIKESVPKLIATETGLSGWNHVKVMEQQNLSEAVNVFLKMLWESRPDEHTRNFTKWAVDQMNDIVDLIQKSEQ